MAARGEQALEKLRTGTPIAKAQRTAGNAGMGG
jgi:hypothetical protein